MENEILKVFYMTHHKFEKNYSTFDFLFLITFPKIVFPFLLEKEKRKQGAKISQVLLF